MFADCLFWDRAQCVFAKSIAKSAGYTPYEPLVLWISGGVLIAGAVLSLHNSWNSGNSGGALGVADLRPKHTGQISRVPNYDVEKWNALVKYDDDIALVAEKLRPYGQKWMDEFAMSYLALNDKRYLPNIVQKIVVAIEEEAARPTADSKP